MKTQFVEDFGGYNFRPVKTGSFNNKGWALFDTPAGTGVCEDPQFSGCDRWKYSAVVFAPGSEDATKVANSLVKKPHAAAESWDARPEHTPDPVGDCQCGQGGAFQFSDGTCSCGH